MHGGAIPGQQLAHAMRKRRRCLATWQSRPLRAQELLGDARVAFECPVNHDRHQEDRVMRHVEEPSGGEVPFAAEVTLHSSIGVR